MINFTFVHPVTGLDFVWPVLVKEHSPLLEKQFNATADAADYLDPDTIHKGGYFTTSLSTHAIAASEFDTFELFRLGTKKGEPILVGASAVPLVGYDYTAIRLGDLKPVTLHGGRWFRFSLNLRFLERF